MLLPWWKNPKDGIGGVGVEWERELSEIAGLLCGEAKSCFRLTSCN